MSDGAGYDRDPNCIVCRCSVEEYLDRGETFRGADLVIHAGSPVGPVRLLPQAGRLGAGMVQAAHAVIEECLDHDIPLCSFSSAEVYNRAGHLAEDDDIRVPPRYNARIEYAIAKTLIEAMTVNSRRQHGLKAIVIRPFNVGGPRQSRTGGFVIPTFVQQALSGEPLTVFGDGQQVRSFLAVSDLCRFLIEFSAASFEKVDRVIYNLGNPANTITVRDLALLVKELTDSPSEIVHVDGREIHGPLYAEAESVEKVPVLGGAAALGWQPRVGLRELILETISYYRTTTDWKHACRSDRKTEASPGCRSAR